jgi:hypothetical protein
MTEEPGTALTPPPQSNLGRTTRLTDDTQAIIIDALQKGMFLETAATLANVGRTTLYRWLQQGATPQTLNDDGEPIPDQWDKYRDFRDACQIARTQAEYAAVEALWDVAKGGALIEESVRYIPGNRDREDGEVVTQKFTGPDAKPMMFLLERMYASRWGRRETLAIVNDADMTGVAAPDEGVGSDRILAVTARVREAIEARRGEEVGDDGVVDAEVLADDI